MPEIHFKIQWPDGRQEICYSPSLVVQNYFQAGEAYTIAEFLERSRTSLQIASDRVEAKFGFPCSRALGQLNKIEAAALPYLQQPEAKVTVIQFEPL